MPDTFDGRQSREREIFSPLFVKNINKAQVAM